MLEYLSFPWDDPRKINGWGTNMQQCRGAAKYVMTDMWLPQNLSAQKKNLWNKENGKQNGETVFLVSKLNMTRSILLK